MPHPTSPVPLPLPETEHDRLQALLGAAEPLVVADAEQARALLSEALPLARTLGDGRGVARALNLLAGSLVIRSQYDEAAQTFAQAREAAVNAGDAASEARAINGLGLVARARGRYGEAMEHYLESLRVAQSCGDDIGHARTLGNVGIVHSELGDHELALQTFETMRQLGERAGHAITQSNAIINMAYAHHELGHFDEALDAARKHLPVIRERGMRQHEVILQATVVSCLAARGDAAEAVSAAEEVLPLAEAVGDREQLAYVRLAYGQALLALHQLDAAEVQLDAALAETRQHSLKPQECQVLHHLSELHARRGAWEQAYRHSQAHHTLDRTLHAQDLDRKTKVVGAQLQVEMLKREADAERIRSAQLAQMNTELSEAQRHLSHRAAHDPLTGLANRSQFHAELERALTTAGTDPVGVLFIDLDRFKQVNDTLGHDVGDELLKEVSVRLRQVVRGGDLVARMGGDEFTVILRHLRTVKDAERVAQKILNVLAQIFTVHGHTLHVTASIGVAVAPQDGQDITTLQRHADIAMYRAKHEGKNAVRTFQPTMGSETAERVDLERDLREALTRGELTLHYQPQFNGPSGQLLGFEALVRWNHPTQGVLPPGRFIGVAEDSGLIVPLGAWVLEEACRQAAAWRSEVPFTISVNVSPLQFGQPDFIDTVQRALITSGLDPQRLILELTETAVVRSPDVAVKQMTHLRLLGIKVALDDFGTGQSSLSLLHTLPIDILKIDRSFVHGGAGSLESTQVMVGVMVSLAHRFRMHVVAEGVETREQLELLNTLGCDSVQGYLLGRPVPAAQAAAFLSSQS
ncbi:EAL domain-containing protein (plasmid) [Deinococcus taeanensis]|uniref:EAL domain-containing protein n=1 Tax=Deinococcus taeanensis TaxID=2737050 RepID=UPI001CDB8E9C|nr:EAL domain-containing protein [Deinococcus taeanensis]UBV45328.1 EAL domain-containing protein [Deinococcus taeanensis]